MNAEIFIFIKMGSSFFIFFFPYFFFYREKPMDFKFSNVYLLKLVKQKVQNLLYTFMAK